MSPTELRARYPWLAEIPDGVIEAWIEAGLRRYTPETYGSMRERALELWVLCNLVNSTPELRSTWAVRSESISAQGRSVSVTYADTNTEGSGNWFCAELERLERALALGGWVA